MTKKEQAAIVERNAALKQIETKLREFVKNATKQIAQANNKIVFASPDNKPIDFNAQTTTDCQIFQLLQDRLTESAFGAEIYRF